MHVPLQLWSAFFTLLATIGPVETAAVFASLTSGVHRTHRTGLATRATLVALGLLLVFALAGNLFLVLLHVSLPAFQIAGGVLLFLQALTLTFSLVERPRWLMEERPDLETADRLLERLGKTGADVVGRISGVLLAALAVQFILDGVQAAI